MERPDFPPNSNVSKEAVERDKDIHRVTSGDVVRKKRPLRKRFSESFVAGTPKLAISFVLLDVVLPAVKDLFVEAAHQGVEKLVFGESRRRGSTAPLSGQYGHIQYNQMGTPSRLSSSQRAISRQARARHDFDEVLLESRTEGEEVIDQLFEVVNRYGAATVADLYQLVGLAATHTDHKWGWTDIRGAGVSRTRDGYLLDLPDPHPLD